MKQYRRITVKIGSNVLARPDGALDITRMSALVDQICSLRKAGIDVIVISSGAVASGRAELAHKELGKIDSVDSRQLFSAIGQVKLMSRYYDLFQSHGVSIGQVLTMKEAFSTRRHYLNQRNCMNVMIDHGVVPIVNENDTISITELMFTDNDELSGLLAAMMDCDALVILSNIDGVYNGDPKDPTSRIISQVAPDDDFSDYILAGRSGFGRGGMVTKYNIARKVADEGIEVVIANGTRDNVLTDLFINNKQVPSTVFQPSTNPHSTLKRWMAHSEGFAKGSITIDDNAVNAITGATAASVLPVGVIAVDGEFEKDDLIRVLDFSGRQLGVGRAAYGSADVRTVIGKHGQRPIIHYDYLYLD